MRLGLTYNEKPDPSSPDEPPSTGDAFAEWDEPTTIAAVEQALGLFGSVVRLEADRDFPRTLAATRPDLVFNMAEGLHGPNRESHVPAICEFLGVPCHASDPLTLSLALHKARAKEILSHRGVPTAPFVLAKSPDLKLMKEEIFGPVLTVTTFETEEEAIRLANDTEYGLAGAVWTLRPAS